jgi:putative DNA primase/helicase
MTGTPIQNFALLENIPNELRARRQWLVWRLENKNGKATKVPYSSQPAQPASTNDPTTWSSFEEAQNALNEGGLNGIGFVFKAEDPYVGIDLDKCRHPETGQVEPWATQIIADLGSCTEISQSGKGLHIIAKGEPPGKKHKTTYGAGAVEIYDSGRYFIMTGNHLKGTPKEIGDRTAELQKVYTKIFRADEPICKQREAGQVQKSTTMPKLPTFAPAHRTFHPPVDDEKLLNLARSAQNGDKFSALFDRGDLSEYESDHSRADFALCSMLAFWAGGDRDRIDKLFRTSKLMRPKWTRRSGRQTYGAITISKVLQQTANENEGGQDEETTSTSVGNNHCGGPVDMMATIPIDQKRCTGIRTAAELSERVAQLGKEGSVIDLIIPSRSLGIIVGDSGLGKSPLLYQAAMCVAAGIDFLDFPVTQGPAIYFGFENGLLQVDMILKKLRQHLNLPEVPKDLYLWNRNDPESESEILDLIRMWEPKLAIIDSLSAYSPGAEDKNSNASALVGRFRPIMASVGCSILCVHHLRKPSAESGSPRPPLRSDNISEWLKQARGAASLINSTDFRIGIDRPKVELANLNDLGAARRREEIALVMGGFERVHGTMPFVHIGRVLDDNGDALGYTRITGEAFLSMEQRAAFAKLPSEFRFKDVKASYGRAGQATTDFLQKCISLGLVRKNPATRIYEKVEKVSTLENWQIDGPIPEQLEFPVT